MLSIEDKGPDPSKGVSIDSFSYGNDITKNAPVVLKNQQQPETDKGPDPSKGVPLDALRPENPEQFQLPDTEAKTSVTPLDPNKGLKERQDELDKQIAKLNNYKAEITKKPFLSTINDALFDHTFSLGNEDEKKKKIQDVDETLTKLTAERQTIANKIAPITPEVMKDINDKTSFSVDKNNIFTTKFSDAIEKYGLPQINRAYTEYWNQQFEKDAKDDVKHYEQMGDTKQMFTYNAVKYGEMPTLNPEETTEIRTLWDKIRNSPEFNGKYSTSPITYDNQVNVANQMVKEFVDSKHLNDENVDTKQKSDDWIKYSKVISSMMQYNPDNGAVTVQGLQAFARANTGQINDRISQLQSIANNLNTIEDKYNKNPESKPPWFVENGTPEQAQKSFNNYQAYKQYVNTELTTLQKTQTLNNAIYNLPLNKNAKKEVGAFGKKNDPSNIDMLDFKAAGLDELSQSQDIVDLNKRVYAGEHLSWGEQKAVELATILNTSLHGKTLETPDLTLKGPSLGFKNVTPASLTGDYLSGIDIPRARDNHELKHLWQLPFATAGELSHAYGSIAHMFDWVQNKMEQGIANIAFGDKTGDKWYDLKKRGLIPNYIGIGGNDETGMLVDMFNEFSEKMPGLPVTSGSPFANAMWSGYKSTVDIIPDIGMTLFMPEAGVPKILAELGVKSFGKWAMYLGAKGMIEKAEESEEGTIKQKLTAPLIGGLEGAAQGFMYDALGIMASKAGSLLARKTMPKLMFADGFEKIDPTSRVSDLKGENVPIFKSTDEALNYQLGSLGYSTLVNMVSFAGMNIIDEYARTGKISAESGVSGAMTGFMLIAKDAGQLLTAKAMNMLVVAPDEFVYRLYTSKVTSEQMAKKAQDLIQGVHEKRSKNVKQDLYLARVCQNMAELKGLLEEHKNDPKAIESIILQSKLEKGTKKYIIQKLKIASKEKAQEGAPLFPKKPKITEADAESIQKHNEEIKGKYPDLYSNGLLEVDKQSGAFIEPDAATLFAIHDQLSEDIDKLSKRNAHDDYINPDKDAIAKINEQLKSLPDTPENTNSRNALLAQIETIRKMPSPELTKLLNQRVAVENHLNEIASNVKLPFNYKLPSEKHQELLNRVATGEPVTGTVSIPGQAIHRMLITMPNGDQVNAYRGTAPGIEETKEEFEERNKLALGAARSKTPVTLKYIPKAEWNPDDKAFESFVNPFTGEVEHVPYGDKLDVMVGDKSIGSVQVHDYSEQQLMRSKFNKAIELAQASENEIVHNLSFDADGKPEMGKKKEKKMQKLVSDMVSGLSNALSTVKTEDVIPWLKGQIDNNNKLKQPEKDFIKNFIDKNKQTISENVMTRRLMDAGFKTQVKGFDPSSMILPENENPALNQSQKIAESLKTFTPIWNDMSNRYNQSQGRLQMEFNRMALNGDISEITNQDTWKAWLLKHRTADDVNNAIVDYLMDMHFPVAVSMLDFYHSVRPVRKIGVYVEKGVIYTKDLNPSESYEDFVNRFGSTLKATGIDKIKELILNRRREQEEAFKYENALSADELYKIKTEQFEKDLDLLFNVTGVSKDVWKQYFQQRTNETKAYAKEGDKRKTDYKTFDNLMRNKVYRRGKKGDYLWRQGDIIFNLLKGNASPAGKDPEQASADIIKYFTEGRDADEDHNVVFSNLYKLSTALGNREDIGIDGRDIKGDHMTSFEQNSNIFTQADNILESAIDNPITRLHKENGVPMQIIIVNGLHNLDINKYKKGTPAEDMSMEDIWATQVSMFANGLDTYQHSIGQFADKPSIYVIEAPKVTNPTEEQFQALYKDLPKKDFDDAVEYLTKKYAYWQDDLYSKLAKNYEGDHFQKLHNMMKAFVYNYAMNTKASNEIFFGDLHSYSNVLNLVKRAGSSNSPGWNMNENVEGGIGSHVRVIVVNDKGIFDDKGNLITDKGADGAIFMSGAWAKRAQVSQGSVYNKEAVYPQLLSMKAVASWLSDATNKRGLYKGNFINVDAISEGTGSQAYKEIADFMKKNGIDVLIPKSSAKVVTDSEVANIYDEKGNFNPDFEVGEQHINNLKTSHIFVQQDLRHPDVPRTAKQPAQFLPNILILPEGGQIAGNISEMQRLSIEQFKDELNQKSSDEAKIDWLRENVNQFSQPDLFRLLDMGLTVDDPSYRKMMHTILSAAINKKVLEIPINRIATQEIPDLDGLSRPLRKTSDGKHVMLPDIATSYRNGREEDERFKGKVQDAIDHINTHAEEYRDLFDDNGKLMKWEIEERDGIIPGEVIISTRVPAHGLPSHTVARLRKNLPGNFTMIDRKGQTNSGSDFDGDQRYNQVFYKRKGNSFFDDTKEGIANHNMMLMVYAYTHPDNFDLINRKIDVNAYDDILEKIGKPSVKLSIDPMAYEAARLNNMVGVTSKGIMTDMMTVYNLLSKHNIRLRNRKYIPVGSGIVEAERFVSGNIMLDQIIKDQYGAVRNHLANLENMSFDNTKDPKIEALGCNEITFPMVILSVIADSRNSSEHFKSFEEHYQHLHDAIGRTMQYMNSPLVREFVSIARRNNGGIRNGDMQSIFENLEHTAETESNEKTPRFTVRDVKDLRSLHFMSSELSDIRNLYRLTESAPTTYVDYIMAQRLVDKFKANNRENGLKIFDTSSFFTSQGEFRTEFRVIDRVLDMCRDYVFDDIPETSEVGKQIQAYVLQKMIGNNPKKLQLTKDELNDVCASINNAFNIRAIGLKQSFGKTSNELLELLPRLKAENPDNEFLKYIRVVKKNGVDTVSILPEYTHGKISDFQMKKIGEAFDKLESHTKDLFASYAIEKYGASSLTSNGGFYALFGDNYRVELSERARNEMNDWYFGDVSSADRLAIADWVIRANRSQDIRKLNDGYTNDRLMDMFTEPSIDVPIRRDALEGIGSIDDITQYLDQANQYEFNRTFSDWLRRELGIPEGTRKVTLKEAREFSTQYAKGRQAIADKFFPQTKEMDEEDVRQLHANDAVGTAMLTHDPELNKFIYDHLQKVFPDIKFFSNRDEFYEFCRKNGARMMDVNMNAVGHAFKKAVFIDPNFPVQEALFHEYGHIYWDGLPDDVRSKLELRKLYKEIFPHLDGEDLDEKIIIDIGRAGTDMANTFAYSKFGRFTETLKDFWRSVKQFFGKYNKTDLVNDMAYDIWRNKNKFGTLSSNVIKEMHNLIEYDSSIEGFNRDKPNHTVIVGNVHLPGIHSVINRAKQNKFDPDDTIQKNLDKFTQFYKENNAGREPTDDETALFIHNTMNRWNARTEAGNAAHMVAQEIFGGVQMDEETSKRFAPGVLNQMRSSMTQMRQELEHKYPECKFYTEHDLISMDHNYFGVADLIMDIGNNHLHVFDFKTTENEYKDADGIITPWYKKPFGLMLPPVSNVQESRYSEHKMQLALEAIALEEQENPDHPGEKNVIDGMYIVPVIQTMGDDGLVKRSYISKIVEIPGEDRSRVMDNIIPVEVNGKDREYAQLILNSYNETVKNLKEIYAEFDKKLQDEKMPQHLRDMYMAMYSYFSSSFNHKMGELDHKDLDGIRLAADKNLYNTLLDLGYEVKDIKTMPTEVLVNAMARGISKAQYLGGGGGGTFYHQVPVDPETVGLYGSTEKVPNPAYKPFDGYYHKEIGGIDVYFHEAGTQTLKLGDPVLRLWETTYQSQKYSSHDFKTVVSVDANKKTVTLKDNDTGATTTEPNVEGNSGILKIHEGEIDKPITDNYVPSTLTQQRDLTQTHWDYGQEPFPGEKSPKAMEEQQKFYMIRKRLWSFYNRYDTREKLLELLDNYQQVVEEFNKLNELKSEDPNWIAKGLHTLLGETLMNHDMARQLNDEVDKDGKPTTFMPLAMNIYHMLTGDNAAITMRFGGFHRFAEYFEPERMIPGQYIGFSYAMSMKNQALFKVHEDQYDMLKKLDPIIGNLNRDNITIKMGNKLFWASPDRNGLSEDERKFLREVYKNYYTYTEKFFSIAQRYDKMGKPVGINEENGMSMYPQLIPVNRVSATTGEFEDLLGDGKKGRKWGSAIHDVMTDPKFDNVSIVVDPKNPGKTVKFGDFKDQFMIENATDAEIEQWMGKKYRYWLKSHKIFPDMSTGKLYDAYMQAQKKYYESDRSNTGRRITSMADQKSKYATKHFVESEIEVMKSNIWAFHMKHVLASTDYVLSHYAGVKNVHDYLQQYMDLMLFKKSPRENKALTGFVNTIMQWKSFSTMVYSLKTQQYNFAVGQAMDITREPAAYATGMKRMGLNPENFTKAFNILRREGLGNIVDESRFNEISKQHGLALEWSQGKKFAPWTLDKFLNKGYLPMEWVERMNQFPIFTGLMTDAEWNAYDKNGEIVPGHEQDALSFSRKYILSSRVKDIHGDYTPENAAPFWNTNAGALFMQFIKWVPAKLYSQFVPYHFDRNYMIRSGIFPTIKTYLNIVRFNNIGEESRRLEYKQALERWPDADKAEEHNKWVAEKYAGNPDMIAKMSIDTKNLKKSTFNLQQQFLQGTRDYMQMLEAGRNGGRIKYADLAEQDHRNLMSGIIGLAMFGGFAAGIGALMESKKKLKGFWPTQKEWLLRFFTRYSGDMYLASNMGPTLNQASSGNFFESKAKNLIPALSLGTNLMKGVRDFTEYIHGLALKAFDPDSYSENLLDTDFGRYTKMTDYNDVGDAKWIYDLFNVLPGGAAIKALEQRRMQVIYAKPYKEYLEKNEHMSPEFIEAISNVVDVTKSTKQIMDDAKRGETLKKALPMSLLWDAMTKDQLFSYRDALQGKAVFNKTKSLSQDAAYLYQWLQQYPLSQEDLDSILEKAGKMEEFLKKGEGRSDKEKMDKLYKAIDFYKDGNPDSLFNVDDILSKYKNTPMNKRIDLTRPKTVIEKLRTGK
jgi:hypothetical protein